MCSLRSQTKNRFKFITSHRLTRTAMLSCAFFHQVVPQGPRLKHGVYGDSMMIWKHSSYANPQKSKWNHEDMIYIKWLSESTDICSIPPTCLVLFVCEERLLFRLHNACVIVSSTSSSKRKCLKWLRDLMPGPIWSQVWWLVANKLFKLHLLPKYFKHSIQWLY